MRFSIWPGASRSWEDIHEITAHCAATGWDGVYIADHFMPNGPGPEPLDGPVLECWSLIAALAATVPRLSLAPLVTSVTYRHPAVLAKIAAAVDQISGGRLTLGIGAGWQINEHAAYGIELGTVGERMDRFEEATQILRDLLSQPRTSFAGEYFRLQDAPNQPGPVAGRLPLLIGGGGERRTLRIAAQYADHWNYWSTPDVLAHKLAVLRGHCEQVGRDPAEIHVSTQALMYLSTDAGWIRAQRDAAPPLPMPVIAGSPAQIADLVGQYREAGADEFIVPDRTLGSVARTKDTCDLFMAEVAAAVR
jgi:F420-dependent oxidoreductase-like protein